MNFIRFACISMALAVLFGSMGAHALKPILSPESLNSWDTAVKYQVYQSLGILLLAIAGRNLAVNARLLNWALRALTIGIIFFSGSLYVRCVALANGISFSWLGPIAPIGGILFMLGWVLAAVAFQPSNSREKN